MATSSPYPSQPTILGLAIRSQRGKLSLESLSSQIFVSIPTLSRLESGSGKPSLSTARSLASWLGWSVVRVMDAAEMKADLRAQVG